MKKALSIILGGVVLVGSSSFIFANDLIQLTTQTQEVTTITEEVSLETTETPTVTIDVLDEIIQDEELEQELLDLIEEILNELEEEIDEEETEVDVEEEEDQEEATNEETQLVLEKLHRNLLKYQLVYNRVPAQAKPAIEKNMKKMQLKIIDQMIKMNQDIDTLCSEMNMEELQSKLSNLTEELKNTELTEEQKQELMNLIATLEMKVTNHEEMVKLVEFVKENENWKKELKNNIHQEFKIEKAKIKAESKISKEEIKQAKKAVQEQMKINKKVSKSAEEDVKIDETIEAEIKIEIKNADKKANEKSAKKDNSVKENNPGKANGKK